MLIIYRKDCPETLLIMSKGSPPPPPLYGTYTSALREGLFVDDEVLIKSANDIMKEEKFKDNLHKR